jgi:hypothetical protein
LAILVGFWEIEITPQHTRNGLLMLSGISLSETPFVESTSVFEAIERNAFDRTPLYKRRSRIFHEVSASQPIQKPATASLLSRSKPLDPNS